MGSASLLMKYTEEEIVEYARSRVHCVDQQKGKRMVLGFMGLGVIAMFLCLVVMIKQKSAETGADVLLDQRFIEGMALGILIILVLGVAALAVVRMSGNFYGKEIEAYRLLLQLKDEKRG